MGKRSKFPDFTLMIDESNTTLLEAGATDSNRTLIIRPDHYSTNNQTYHLSLHVKEKNSDLIKTKYNLEIYVKQEIGAVCLRFGLFVSLLSAVLF